MGMRMKRVSQTVRAEEKILFFLQDRSCLFIYLKSHREIFIYMGTLKTRHDDDDNDDTTCWNKLV